MEGVKWLHRKIVVYHFNQIRMGSLVEQTQHRKLVIQTKFIRRVYRRFRPMTYFLQQFRRIVSWQIAQ